MNELDDCEVQLVVPHPNPDTCKVSCLYIPSTLTNKDENHRHIFIGMEEGNIYIFDLLTRKFASFFIDFKNLRLPKQVPEDACEVNDIKCHMTKMHRLLISFSRTAIVVFSINKARNIQTLMIKEKLQEKGKALAVEWIGPECREFIVGFSRGAIEVYQAESNRARPIRVIEFAATQMKSLDLTVLQRPKAHYYLIMTFTRDMNNKELEKQDQADKDHEDSIMNGEATEVVVKKGGLNFEEEIRIDKKFFEKRDSIFLTAAGLF